VSTDTAEDEVGPDEPLPKDEESCRGEETSTDIRPPPSVLGDSDGDNSDDSSDAVGDGAFVGRVSVSEEEHEL
jgi:hypothetical protein